MKKMNKGPLQVFFGSALWGTDAVFRVQLTKAFSSMHIVFFEHIFGALFSLPLMIRNLKLFRKMNKLDWLSLFYIALGGGVIATFFITQSFRLAFQYGNINVPVLMQKIQPFFAIIAAYILLRERIKPLFWLYALIALIGGYILSFGFSITGFSLTSNTMLISLYSLGAAFFWGTSTVVGKRLVDRLGFQFTTAIRLSAGFLMLLVIMLFTDILDAVSLLNLKFLLFFMYIGLITGFLSLLIYYLGMIKTKAHIATIAELGMPISAVFFNWLWLKETISFNHILGAVMIIGSIVMMGFIDRRTVKSAKDRTSA